MPIIISLIIAIFLISISWGWQNLEELEKPKKIALITILVIIIFVLTIIMFNISKTGIEYKTNEEEENVRNVMVSLFTSVNSLIIMPITTKIIGKIRENSNVKKIFIISIIVLFIVMIVECNYMKGIQEEILKIYTNAIRK